MMCFGLKDRKRVRTNHCVIVLLDDTQLVHELHASSTGQDLLDVVIKHLNLLETSYFGLRYLEPALSGGKFEQVWLDVDKSAIKQLRNVQPMTVYFGVKYYAADPCKLAEEITRYQFFLQCKQDIFNSRLPISFELAIELFALAVQSELGDYDPQRHQDGYVSEFQFLPGQSMELEQRVGQFHRTKLVGQVPATAEMNFLERVKWLDLYGCQLHPIQYEDTVGEEYALGLNPSGVLVLRNKLKVAHYLWPRIVKTKCQGRCLLMDVIDNGGGIVNGGKHSLERMPTNRFGFRLADKSASQRLRWAIEEHKSFHQLVRSSATLRQQHQHQQQQMKLSQRFRNSIRSAINVGQLNGVQQQLAAQQEKLLRSSMKCQQQQSQVTSSGPQQYAIDSRPPPTVVRMPSRRYSNRSLPRGPYGGLQMGALAANGNGLPSASMQQQQHNAGAVGLPHTMLESQRQQALMMMNHLSQMNSMAGKSQTLKPMSSSRLLDSKEAKRSPYYQMMMMAAGQQQPDVAIVPPGRHIVQPSVYKASSVVNGINQLGTGKQLVGPMMAQFFSTPARPQYGYYGNGHESPRSTKSAIASSSVMKAASKKLAKQHRQQQQQLLLYDNQADVQPLLAYDPTSQQQQYSNLHYYGASSLAYSANPSPRSVRSARLSNSRHKSKSTGENLHLLHQQQQCAANKMLLTTAQLPPPNYHASRPSRRASNGAGSDSESELSKRSAPMIGQKKRTTFAINNNNSSSNQLNLLNTNGLVEGGGSKQQPKVGRTNSDGDDDYCCSRSDCSSIDDGSGGALTSRQIGQQRRRRPTNINQQQQMEHCQSNLRQSRPTISEQQEWDAIRRRHSEFSSGKGFLMNQNLANSQTDKQRGSRRAAYLDQSENNNNGNCSQVVKNIANKQATPILLSMNIDQSSANNAKAVQLLNLQRQQLNSNPDGCTKGISSSAADSGASSVASSPQATQQQLQQQQEQQQAGIKLMAAKTGDSTASSSTTSGYYAGSNQSTGSASADSDSQATVDHTNSGANHSKGLGSQIRLQANNNNNNNYLPQDWQQEQQLEASSRAKIALGSYASSRIAGNRILIGSQLNNTRTNQTLTDKVGAGQQKKQFYLGEANNNNNHNHNDNQDNRQSPQANKTNNSQQWSPLNQIQQHAPSSLKYVSFDV